MRAIPRAFRRPRIPVTGARAGPESRHPSDPADTRGIARMARSYEGAVLREEFPGIRMAGDASLDAALGASP